MVNWVFWPHVMVDVIRCIAIPESDGHHRAMYQSEQFTATDSIVEVGILKNCETSQKSSFMIVACQRPSRRYRNRLYRSNVHRLQSLPHIIIGTVSI